MEIDGNWVEVAKGSVLIQKNNSRGKLSKHLYTRKDRCLL